MKRLAWIQMIMMLGSFWAMVEGFGILSNILQICLVMILFITAKKINYLRMALVTLLLYVFTHLLALFGNLYDNYQMMILLLPSLALNISLFNEYLTNFKRIDAIESAYLSYLIGAIVFGLGLFVLYDVSSVLVEISYNYSSIVAMVMIIFIPYLFMMTLAFLKHNN